MPAHLRRSATFYAIKTGFRKHGGEFDEDPTFSPNPVTPPPGPSTTPSSPTSVRSHPVSNSSSSSTQSFQSSSSTRSAPDSASALSASSQPTQPVSNTKRQSGMQGAYSAQNLSGDHSQDGAHVQYSFETRAPQVSHSAGSCMTTSLPGCDSEHNFSKSGYLALENTIPSVPVSSAALSQGRQTGDDQESLGLTVSRTGTAPTSSSRCSKCHCLLVQDAENTRCPQDCQ